MATRISALAATALAAAVAAPVARAAGPIVAPIVLEGDAVPRAGHVTRIDKVAVSSAGLWLVEALTDYPAGGADSVILRRGALHLREGRALSEPAGASIAYFGALDVDPAGNLLWTIGLSGPPFGEDTGLYWNTHLLIQAGATSNAAGFSPGTEYLLFYASRADDAGRALVLAAVDDPLIPSTTDQAIVRVDYDAGADRLVETVVAKENDLLPGQTLHVATFQTAPHTFDLGASGHVIYTVDLEGSSPDDTAVILNGAAIVQEGSTSPAGVLWAPLTNSARVAVDAAGRWVVGGHVYSGDPATDYLIARNGAVFRQKGGALPGVAGAAITTFGSGPLVLSSANRLLWYAQWNDPDPGADAALFIDDAILVREGMQLLGGGAITEIAATPYAYAMSRSGRYVIFEASLADGRRGAFLADRMPACPADLDLGGTVGFADLLLLLASWGPCADLACAADLDGSGAIDSADLAALLSGWGMCGAP
jgi:hypothetical protein